MHKHTFLTILILLFILPLVSADIIAPSPVFLASGLILGLLFVFGVNFLINIGIIHLAIHLFKGHVRIEKCPKLKVVYVTILGLIIDTIVISSFYKPFYATTYFFIGASVFIGAGLVSFLLIFQPMLDRKEALLASALFGLISNPVWMLLVVGY